MIKLLSLLVLFPLSQQVVKTTPPFVTTANKPGSCVSVGITGADGGTTTTVLPINLSRRAAAICAKSDNTDTVFVKLGANATTANFPLAAGQCVNLTAPGTIYTGIVDATANTGTQKVCVLELQ